MCVPCMSLVFVGGSNKCANASAFLKCLPAPSVPALSILEWVGATQLVHPLFQPYQYLSGSVLPTRAPSVPALSILEWVGATQLVHPLSQPYQYLSGLVLHNSCTLCPSPINT